MSHPASDVELHIARYLVAAGIAFGAVSPTLPDSEPGSVRSIVQGIAFALIGVGVYLGAPKPGG